MLAVCVSEVEGWKVNNKPLTNRRRRRHARTWKKPRKKGRKMVEEGAMNTSMLDTEDALDIETDRDPAAVVMKHADAPLAETVAEAVAGIAPRRLRKWGDAVA